MRVESLMTGPLEPTNEAYALAKLAGIRLCQACRLEHGIDCIVGIPANAYGPGDDFSLQDSHVVAGLIRRFHEAKSCGADAVTLWGTGEPRREFVYVDDLAEACLLLMERYSAETPVNLGGSADLTIRALAERIRDVVGFAGELRYDRERSDGMPVKVLDSSVLTGLGFRARTSIDEGLARTYRWFCEHEARR